MMERTGKPDRKRDRPLFALPNRFRLFEFEIESVLGHGGFGITYCAIDTLLQENVALKEYLPSEIAVRRSDSSVQPKSAEMRHDYTAGLTAFLTEARMMARFRHPRVVQVRRFFEHYGTGYIVLDYERGKTLSQHLAAGQLPKDELERIFFGVLEALEVLHDRAILHRDLKPSNIILRNDIDPVLIDFGAARDFLARNSRSVTAVVTEGYSPPEQYGLGGEQGPWSDLYALGAIAYRCVTGVAPPDSRRRLRNDPLVPAVQAADPIYGMEFLRLVDWMLSIDEMNRPISVDQVRDALRRSGESSDIAASGTTPPRERPVVDEEPHRSSRSPNSSPVQTPSRNPSVLRAELSSAKIPEGQVALSEVRGGTRGCTIIEFSQPIEADVLELAFHVAPPNLYLAVGGPEPEWRPTPYYFSIARTAALSSVSTFEVGPDLTNSIPGGALVTLSSSDDFIHTATLWPARETKDSVSSRWLILFAAVLTLIAVGLLSSYLVFRG